MTHIVKQHSSFGLNLYVNDQTITIEVNDWLGYKVSFEERAFSKSCYRIFVKEINFSNPQSPKWQKRFNFE